MGMRYVVTNLLNSTTLPADDATYRSSEDTIYQVEYLYNVRPSKPFRWTAKVGNWVKADFGSRQYVDFCGIFNHNFGSAATVQLHASGWNGGWKLVKNFTYRKNDMFKNFGIHERWIRLSASDATNDNCLQMGELVLGSKQSLSDCHLQSPRSDGTQFFTNANVTHYGQDWDDYLSQNEHFSLTFKKLNNPDNVDAFQTFLQDVFENGNRFVLIPDVDRPHVYYCKIDKTEGFSSLEIIGDAKELREWTIEVKTLTRGITLL